MTLRKLSRRGLITGAAAIAAHEALAAGLGGSVTPQIGGGIDSGVSDGGPLGGASAPAGFAFKLDLTGAPVLDLNNQPILVRIA